jgi:hypothetical protein
MTRFLGLYHFVASLRYLPFPVRKEPLGDYPFRVNGDGKALYSWRAEVSDLGFPWPVCWDRSQPWDSPANRGLIWRDQIFAGDHTPMPTEDSIRRQKSFPQTVMVAIVGPGTAFADGRVQTPLIELSPRAALLLPPGAVLIVESRASGIPWPAPGDFDIRTMPRTINAQDGSGISGQSAGGFVVLFADGQAWFLSEKVPFETLEKFFTIEGARTHDREKLLGPFALDGLTGGGKHPAGEIRVHKGKEAKTR